ncbi:MAG: DUF4258 domain-containing protein [Okeania sp. SIO2G4]|uniref:DUF4258 domain-containing protein n=1 Tax=unclassified Okeania TaxID=2634635 RepID=UPI0013BA17EC|nr:MULTISPECIES: DUF4258 domain-containing protein [unclassified Okeania]NEP04503.1 DUF4258 domain-containing protein [Okeania sp. SIO4D6]NEP73666.1 DUF4258 domain-containing protein [Okeania sp. SIO2G5]NEP94384.1 DUF4258 domain-containing protein [Okeania sp. SIO2F5]NEQ92226.1 DUF4258 domain-containing protein [Okeania sp. SIO2G4]
MSNIEYSLHARNVMEERAISEEWINRTLNEPDYNQEIDNTTHYIKAIPEFGGRFLRVVVNVSVEPNRVVTVFFDRRIRR